MKKKIKTALLHKISAWCSLIINGSVFGVVYIVVNDNLEMLMGLIILLLVISISGVVNISYQMQVKDISIIPIVFTYICSFSISVILVYTAYQDGILSVAIILSVLLLIELVASIAISYRPHSNRRR